MQVFPTWLPLHRGRVSLKELSGLIGLSSPSVAERIKRLEESGVILGYAAVLDPREMGNPIEALVRMNPLPGAIKAAEAMIREIHEIVECDRVTGEDCFVARLHLRSIADLDTVMDPFHEIARTNTAIVKRRPVPPVGSGE